MWIIWILEALYLTRRCYTTAAVLRGARAGMFVNDVMERFQKSSKHELNSADRHKLNDGIVAALLMTYLWADIVNRQKKLSAPDASAFRNLVLSKLAPCLQSLAATMSAKPRDASVNETYQYIREGIANAYVRHIAPEWDETLVQYVSTPIGNKGLNYYIDNYKSFVTSSDNWASAVAKAFNTEKLIVQDHVLLFNHLAASPIIMERMTAIASSAAMALSSFIPMAMLTASDHVHSSASVIQDSSQGGDVALFTPGMALNAPRKYNHIRRSSTIALNLDVTFVSDTISDLDQNVMEDYAAAHYAIRAALNESTTPLPVTEEEQIAALAAQWGATVRRPRKGKKDSKRP